MRPKAWVVASARRDVGGRPHMSFGVGHAQCEHRATSVGRTRMLRGIGRFDNPLLSRTGAAQADA